MTIILRPDQAELKQAVYNEWNAGHSNVLAVACTGFGKSIVTTDVLLDGHHLNMNEVVMAHRNELVGQMSLHTAARGIKHRIIGSKATVAGIIQDHRAAFGKSFVNPDARCAVGSVQTIVSRAAELKQWAAQIDRFTGDEGHHFLRDNTWGKAAKLFTNARGLLVTACPQRADGKGLGTHADGIVDSMVEGPTMAQVVDMGSLAPYEMVIPSSDYSIGDDAITPGGDFSPVKMKEASKRSHIVGDVVQEYMRHAMGRRAICFATDVETSTDIANRFNEAGIPAASVSAKTDFGVRRDMIKRFRDGRIAVLVNVDLFDEGFDLPACDVTIMARPTASLNKYLQSCGRCMRRDPANPAKVALIIDHVSNFKRHGLPDQRRTWTLDRRDKRAKAAPDPDDIPLTACKSCSRPYERVLHACPYCGAVPAAPEPGSRTPERVDGDLMLLDRETLARLRAAIQLEAPGDVAERVTRAAGDIAGRGAANRQMAKHTTQADLAAALNQWAGIRRAAGEDDRSIHKRYYLATGMTVLDALAQDRQGMEAMAAQVRAWYT